MNCSQLVTLLMAPALPASAQDSAELRNRLAAFQNAQVACKAVVITNSEAAISFVRATKSSLTGVCAALLTISSKSKQEISALASGDQAVSIRVANEVRERFVQCVKISKDAA